MNTGADVSYLLKAREALNESEKAERDGCGGYAEEKAYDAIGNLMCWIESIKEKEAA